VLNCSEGSDILEQLKEWLQKEDKDTYQKWKEKEFDISHRFGFKPLDQYNINELTLLHIAVQCTNEKVVQALLDKALRSRPYIWVIHGIVKGWEIVLLALKIT